MNSDRNVKRKGRVPFAEGFLTTPLSDLNNVRFTGSRCRSCGIALLSKRHRCENCSSKNLDDQVFSNKGKIYSYTVQRYPPPKPYFGPDPWTPRPLAWVDINEGGPRVLSPIDCEPDALKIGMEVELILETGGEDNKGNDVIIYKFKPL